VTEISVWQARLPDHLEQELAARGIELARHVVEQQHGHVAEARLDVLELGELEREHERAELALRRVLAREAPLEADLDVVGVRARAREAAALVEGALPAQAGQQRRTHALLVARGVDGGGAAVAQLDGRFGVQRVEEARSCAGASRRRARGGAARPGARARQLLVVGVEQHGTRTVRA
jgi:hypothetical protein